MLKAPLLCLLACAGFAAGLTTPSAAQRVPRPTMRSTRQRFAYMSEAEEEVAMSEEDFIAMEDNGPEELSAEAQRVYRGMRSSTGVEFAPWMKVDAEKVAAAKKAREDRMARAASGDVDQLRIDPQAAELGAGGGLKSKVLSEEEVELRWSTGDEEGNAGFIVQRRPGGSNTFENVESFESFAPLRTKGAAGGDYSYLDDSIPSPGTFVYRILDCDTTGVKSAICQKLVEVESQSEQTQQIVVGVVIFSIAIAGFIFGIVSDPLQTTDQGGKLF